MRKKRGIDAILADIMMVLLSVTIMILVTMDMAEQQNLAQSDEAIAEEFENAEEDQQDIDSVEIPANEENQDAIESGMIITLLEAGYEIRYKGQQTMANSSAELQASIQQFAGQQQPKVIVVASPTERFQTVIENLELIDRAVAWGTPEVGLMN